MLTLADLPPEEKEKIQRIVEKVVSLGQENDELLRKYGQESQQHDALVSELQAKLQNATGLLYLYQSSLESKVATDIGADEYEVLLVEKQATIVELRQNQAELGSELETVRLTLSSRDQQVDELSSQLRYGRKQLDETKERCNRLEAACLGLTKQLTAIGLRMRTTVKDQHKSTEGQGKNRCHASTQCDEEPRVISTPSRRHTATKATSPITIAAARPSTQSERILTMAGYVAVPVVSVPFPTIEEGCRKGWDNQCSSDDDALLRRSTTSIHEKTTATGQRASRQHNEGVDEDSSRSRGATISASSPCTEAQRRNAEREDIKPLVTTTVTATVLRRRPSTSAEAVAIPEIVASTVPHSTAVRSIRRPLVDIVDVSVRRCKQQTTKQAIAVAATKPTRQQQKQQMIKLNSPRVLFDGDYDAEFFLLHDIEKL